MLSLINTNVWLPILVGSHPHHAVTTAWWDQQSAADCCWCRPVQQTILRRLSNRGVMGDHTHSPDEARLAWGELMLDERCAFLPLEPAGLDVAWGKTITGRTATPKLWMDAYLAAWSDASGLAFVTFDTGFKNFALQNLQLLKPE